MSGARSRNKGARWERALVKLFQAVMPDAEVKRGFQYRSGAEVPNVECPVFWVEAKVGAKPNVRGALKQAMEAAPKGKVCVAAIKDDRSDPFVALKLDDFLDLVKEWWELRNQ